MSSLKKLEKKLSHKKVKTQSALSSSLSRKAWFEEMWRAAQQLFGTSRSSRGASKSRITQSDEQFEQELYALRNDW